MKNELKSKEYLRWISNFPCVFCFILGDYKGVPCVCAQETVVPHHLPNDNHTRRHADLGSVIPLGTAHHMLIHKNLKKERDVLDVLKKLAKEYTKKWLTFKKESV